MSQQIFLILMVKHKNLHLFFDPLFLGVAADLNFISDLNEGIAPSLLNMTSLPDLPVVEAPEPDLPQIESKEAPPAPPDPAPQTIPPPPPSIPPPPPVDIPPPPPLSVPAPPPVTPSSVPVEASADSARSDLLASIRNAGGIGKVKLKSSKERRMEKKKEAQIPKDTSSSSGGGDLMGDLFAKIAMRRIGISGSKHPAGNPSNEGSALEKISAMIPPPTAPTASVDEEDDDEWD